MKCFQDKTVLVTGAASGMGKALTVRLTHLGAHVVATDVNDDGLLRLADDCAGSAGSLRAQRLDVTDKVAFTDLVEELAADGLDYLFNNAGIGIVKEVKDTTDEEWQRTMAVNQQGVLNGTLAAYDVMRRQGSGHIVNTASIAGLMPAPMLTAYAMTKHAVLGLSLSLREEAKVYGVKVSAVCPGIVETNIVGADQMQRLQLDGDDPFEFIRRKAHIKPITADQAAEYILKGVEKNQPEIVFPLHGRMAVASFRNMRKVWEVAVAGGLKVMRNEG
ncbi:MAG: SDR family oxidoreductase [Alcanivoracaceae bacterium]|jgi:NAD(P)-dependent dehydrogenase (short-subunit alcohol dehydrogenase family)|nr:SDR family oxidoreductase [Alcanivoracaceae bacterium]